MFTTVFIVSSHKETETSLWYCWVFAQVCFSPDPQPSHRRISDPAPVHYAPPVKGAGSWVDRLSGESSLALVDIRIMQELPEPISRHFNAVCVERALGNSIPRMLWFHPVLLVNEWHWSNMQADDHSTSRTSCFNTIAEPQDSAMTFFCQGFAKSEWKGFTLISILRRNRYRDEYCPRIVYHPHVFPQI